MTRLHVQNIALQLWKSGHLPKKGAQEEVGNVRNTNMRWAFEKTSPLVSSVGPNRENSLLSRNPAD